MRRFQFIGVSLAVLVLLVSTGIALAQEAVTVNLEEVNGSGVSGTASATAVEGGATVSINLQGLAPNTPARVTVNAGTCETPSASFAAVTDLTVNAEGNAADSGEVQFRGTEGVDFATLVDGDHVILVNQADTVVACGVIPAQAVAAAAPGTLPETGGFPLLATAAFGLLALGSGLILRRTG